MNTIILEVPSLPDMRLSGNGRRRRGHQEIARLTREANGYWYWAMHEYLYLDRINWESKHRFWVFPWQRVRLSWELTYPTRRIPDDDNVYAALKVVRDTLAVPRGERFGLGLIPDDSPAHVVSTTLTQRYERGVRQTRITLEEVPA